MSSQHRGIKAVLAVLLAIDAVAAGWVAATRSWISYSSFGPAGGGISGGFTTSYSHPELHLGWWQFRPTILTLVIVAAVALLGAALVALLPHWSLALSAGAAAIVGGLILVVYGHPSFDTIRVGQYALDPGLGKGAYAGLVAVLSALALGVVARLAPERYPVESQVAPELTPWTPPGFAPA